MLPELVWYAPENGARPVRASRVRQDTKDSRYWHIKVEHPIVPYLCTVPGTCLTERSVSGTFSPGQTVWFRLYATDRAKKGVIVSRDEKRPDLWKVRFSQSFSPSYGYTSMCEEHQLRSDDDEQDDL